MNAERMAKAAAWEWEKQEAQKNKVRGWPSLRLAYYDYLSWPGMRPMAAGCSCSA